MEDFVLTLQPLSDGHLVFAESRLVGQVAPHKISLRDRQALEALGERLRKHPLREVAGAVEVGRKLFGHLFGSGIARHFWKALHEAQDDGGLRVLLRFSEDDGLQDLPWELLHDGTWPLALNPATPIARYLQMDRAVRVPPPGRKLRVLFTAASPPGTPVLDLGTEEIKIRTHLKSLKNIDLEIDSKITPKRLERLLSFAENAKRPFHIWHHAGHGFVDDRSGFCLCLEGKEEERHLGTLGISRMLSACPNLFAAVFNVCHGAILATALAREHLPVAIGFREQILDRAALLFAQQFYGSLSRHSVEVAVANSRLALAYQGCPLLNWTKPLLYTRTTRAVNLGEGRDGRRGGA